MASMTTLEAALGRRPTFEEVADALAAAFEAEHGLALRPGGLSWDEHALVEQLVADKYATDAWLAGVASDATVIRGAPRLRRGAPSVAVRGESRSGDEPSPSMIENGLGGPAARPPMS